MAPIIMGLDMLEVACVLERRDVPVQLAHPEMDVGVPIADSTEVAFEVTDIHGVKTNLLRETEC
jgi:hypothetical protein